MRRTLSQNFFLLFHGVVSWLLLYFLSLFSSLRRMLLLQRDTSFLCFSLPQLFEVQEDQWRTCSIQLQRFCTHVHDCAFYFEDTTVCEDVTACTDSLNCKFRVHELSRLSWLERQLKKCTTEIRGRQDWN